MPAGNRPRRAHTPPRRLPAEPGRTPQPGDHTGASQHPRRKRHQAQGQQREIAPPHRGRTGSGGEHTPIVGRRVSRQQLSAEQGRGSAPAFIGTVREGDGEQRGVAGTAHHVQRNHVPHAGGRGRGGFAVAHSGGASVLLQGIGDAASYLRRGGVPREGGADREGRADGRLDGRKRRIRLGSVRTMAVQRGGDGATGRRERRLWGCRRSRQSRQRTKVPPKREQRKVHRRMLPRFAWEGVVRPIHVQRGGHVVETGRNGRAASLRILGDGPGQARYAHRRLRPTFGSALRVQPPPDSTGVRNPVPSRSAENTEITDLDTEGGDTVRRRRLVRLRRRTGRRRQGGRGGRGGVGIVRHGPSSVDLPLVPYQPGRSGRSLRRRGTSNPPRSPHLGRFRIG
mmetsp:Transcript_17179/g.49747  ORF Transcript_17179/g.49747 Transcript_17179/m.49747 type:complete len:397 (-) Transcript_17179:277-1467(-)